MPGFCKCPKWCPKWLTNYAVIRLLQKDQDDNRVQPVEYFAASQEVFCATLILTWGMTYIWFQDQIFKHPARPIIGAYNPCFGWDYPPASYIALTFCSCNVYLTWRYAFLEQTRTNLLNPGPQTCRPRFAKSTSILLQLTSNLWLLLWLLGPNDDHPHDSDGPNMRNWFIHTGIFVSYGVAAYMAALGNYVEVKFGPYCENVKLKHTIYMCVYGACLLYLVFVYLYDLLIYENGEEPALHPAFTLVADWLWIASFGNSNHFMPYEPPLHITTRVILDGEEDLEGDRLTSSDDVQKTPKSAEESACF